MPKGEPTIRTLARILGISPTTVSDALNGRGRVSAATIERVRRAARDLGYRQNPLTGAVMSAIRRARSGTFHGMIAIVEAHEPEYPPHGPFQLEITAGIRDRAGQLGFGTEEFQFGTRAMTLRRLQEILHARGILGIAVLPSWIPPDLRELDWREFAGIYTDYLIEQPGLNAVCADHYHLMISALSVLEERGYRRPGYLVPRGRDARIEHRQTAAYRAFLASELGEERLPPLITQDEPTPEGFRTWFRRVRPDVVLSHTEQVLDWMADAGARVPETHGFVLLNVIGRSRPCACMDLQGRLIGMRAADMLIGQILRGEFGVPESPLRTAVQPRWIDGPTVRAARKA